MSMSAKSMIEVIRAHEDGAELQYRPTGNHCDGRTTPWKDYENTEWQKTEILWDFSCFEFRVKPDPPIDPVTYIIHSQRFEERETTDGRTTSFWVDLRAFGVSVEITTAMLSRNVKKDRDFINLIKSGKQIQVTLSEVDEQSTEEVGDE